MNMTGSTGVNDNGRRGSSSMCAVCLSLRVVRRCKWAAVTQRIIREVDHGGCEALFELYMMQVLIIAIRISSPSIYSIVGLLLTLFIPHPLLFGQPLLLL